MGPRDVLRKIQKLDRHLWEKQFLLESNEAIITSNGNEHWVSSTADFSAANHYHLSTLDEYSRLVSNRLFTFLLKDFSILQLGYAFRRNNLIKHRLSYYPCPLLVSVEDVVSVGGITEYIEMLDPVTLKGSMRFATPLRFDFDSLSVTPEHPESHCTLFHDNCRIPVFGPLSIGHFIRFVFGNFYPDLCKKDPDLLAWPLDWMNRTLTDAHSEHIHLECKNLNLSRTRRRH